MRPASTIREQKSKLRIQMRGILASLPADCRRQKSLRIVSKIRRSNVYQKALRVLVYLPLTREVDIKSLIRAALREKKQVYAPRVSPGGNVMQAYRIEDWKRDLRRGSYGILEPRARRDRRISAKALDLVLAPGLAFDGRGGRLGRGRGCFDRYLKKAARAQVWGVAFREQKCRSVPMASHDVKMNRVLTD